MRQIRLTMLTSVLLISIILLSGCGKSRIDSDNLEDNTVPVPSNTTLYEDFESGTMTKWTISHYGNNPNRPAHMNIALGFNGSQFSGAFQFSGTGSQNTYRLPMENDNQFFLSLDIYQNGAYMYHGMIGLRIDTDFGPRLIVWDAYRNPYHYNDLHNGTKPTIADYDDFAVISLGNPAEEPNNPGVKHFKVDIDEQLQIFEPGNHIRKIWYLDYGSGNNIDNIVLSSN